MENYYVGLDVHSKQSTFVIEDEGGKIVAQGEIATTPAGLSGLLERGPLVPGTKVALETGTVAFFVARQLSRLGLEPVIVDAHEVRLKAYRRNQKCDRRDALELCEGLRCGIYRSIVHVPRHEICLMRGALSRRRHFVRLQAAQTCAVKALLRGAGLGHLSRSLSTETGWTKLLAILSGQHEWAEVCAHVRQHHALWRCAGEQVVTVEKSLASLHREPAADEAMRRLQTIPGVGQIVAATALAVFSQVDRFPDAKHVASYVGLVPSTYSSGEREAYGRVTKRGSAELRAMLCQAAHHAARPDHPLNPYFAKLSARRGYKMAVTAVAHRLCRIMFAMLRSHRDFDVAMLGIEYGPFEVKRVRAYRLARGRVQETARG